ncbi:MAG: ferrous iron transporter B [candidate division WOR-3 bacterium]
MSEDAMRHMYKHRRRHSERSGKKIALIGNPNVGKSCLFNYLTGIGVQVANYPGTTVEVYEGRTRIHGTHIDVVDLPGTYSIGGSSVEDKIIRNYLYDERPDAIINIIDANLLERNLYLTLQLIELGAPIVVALNFCEECRDAGIEIDPKALERELGVPVVPIDARRGGGISELVEKALQVSREPWGPMMLRRRHDSTEKAKERHDKAGQIAERVKVSKKPDYTGQERLDRITTEPFSGTVVMALVLAALFSSLLLVGGFLEGLIIQAFDGFIAPALNSLIDGISDEAARTALEYALVLGLEAGLSIVVPYILVFYFFLSFLEDTGYLPRMGYLLDRFMHRLGLHGKAIVPMLMGFGCTVPAIISTRLLQSKRERLITAILLSFIPCSARTAIILGAVGFYLGWAYALSIYAILLALVFAAGIVLSRWLPGKPEGLIMEMPRYRKPSIRSVMKKSWIKVKSFVYIAFPILMIGSGLLGLLKGARVLEAMTVPFEPLIGGWLMLPAVTGVALIYGILRKEMALETLLILAGTADLLVFMTPLQIYVFALVSAIYVPCVTTIGILFKEFGLRRTALISGTTISIAILAGGVVARIFPALGILS